MTEGNVHFQSKTEILVLVFTSSCNSYIHV